MFLGQKQPKGFSIFFLTEMWERYGYYILQTMLVFYTLNKLHLNDTETYKIVGSFTAFSYVYSTFGGFIADRYIGYVKAIVLGASFLCIGYFLLAISTNLNSFILGLAIITMGTGLLKPNVSSMLSILYTQDSNKQIGYTLFYIGIYFGAISGSFIGGYIKQYFGWHIAFFSASIGLVVALIIFIVGKIKYKLADQRKVATNFTNICSAFFILIGLIFTAYISMTNDFLANLIFILVTLLSFGFIIKNILTYQNVEKKKLLAFAILILFSIVYWAIYFQQFFSVSLSIQRVTATILPKSSLSAFESLGIIVFGPFINAIWIYLNAKNKDLSIPAKFSISFLFNSLAFLLLMYGLHYAIIHKQMQNQLFIIGSYILIAIGELCISPIGLAMVSTLVPKQLQGAMMGIFLMSIGLGGKLAGKLAETSVISKLNLSIGYTEQIYLQSFDLYFIYSFVTFILCLICIKPIKKLIY